MRPHEATQRPSAMTTPDPDRKSAPFEWRALTINKVEQIQLARLHEEQDRIERELRERDAREREARRVEAREREGDALEQAWFDAGAAAPRETLDDFDTHEEIPPFTPVQRLVHSLAAFGRRLRRPTPKLRSSVPPPPLNESPISLSLVLAACAFGGSVYLSLRWVAEVRQAQLTQQVTAALSASIPQPAPTIAPRVNSSPLAPPTASGISPTLAPSAEANVQATEQAAVLALSTMASSPESRPNPPAPQAVTAPKATTTLHEDVIIAPNAEHDDTRSVRVSSRLAVSAPLTPAVTSTMLPNVRSLANTPTKISSQEPVVNASPATPNAATPPTSDRAAAGPRAPVPAAGRPPSSGTRVYRAGE